MGDLRLVSATFPSQNDAARVTEGPFCWEFSSVVANNRPDLIPNIKLPIPGV